MSQAPGSTGPTTAVVLDKRPVADGVVVLELGHPDGERLGDWAPGAHLDLVLTPGLTRTYSLCGDRWDPDRWRVAVLREPDGRGGSAYVHDRLRVGDVVGVGGPRNAFALVPAPRYTFVAGGIGITPLLPMIAQADLLGADWRLLYGGRRRSSMAFLDELAGYGDRVVVHPEDGHGLLPLAAWVPTEDPGAPTYACGPPALLAAVEARAARWPEGRLRTERFVAREAGPPVRRTPFEVELRRTGATVTVDPGTSVLAAARAAGASIVSSCEHGVCGTCETAVLAGRPDHRDSLLDDDERAAGTCLFPCVSRSLDDRLVLDL